MLVSLNPQVMSAVNTEKLNTNTKQLKITIRGDPYVSFAYVVCLFVILYY